MKRKIVHITTVHSAMDARILYREAVSLAEMGFDVTVFGPTAEDTRIGGVAVRRIPPARSRLSRLLTSWIRGLGVLRSFDADVYHFHDPELLPAAVLGKLLIGKAVVFDMHEDMSLLMAKDWLPRWVRWPVRGIMEVIDVLSARLMDGMVVPTRRLHEKYARRMRFGKIAIEWNVSANGFNGSPSRGHLF
jgi:hypothetical protein